MLEPALLRGRERYERVVDAWVDNLHDDALTHTVRIVEPERAVELEAVVRNWHNLKFILEAEGAILCFILYLIPGFPKDIISYLFGISPMPFWVFAILSTIGRLPGTWIGSYFGAHVGDQQYIYAGVFIALVAAVCIPIYYYRDRIIQHLRRRRREYMSRKGLDRPHPPS
jgi:SNARE associated Golgi protein